MPNQTHRTIIFEEFDDTNPDNLFTILNNDPLGDELTIGLKKLTVSTFQEFLKKFAPKVYEVYGRNANGGIEFFYTTNPQEYAGFPRTELKIDEHIYYKMLERLIIPRFYFIFQIRAEKYYKFYFQKNVAYEFVLC